MEEVKVLSYREKGFVMRVELALKAKGIENTLIVEDLTNKSELLLSSNPLYQTVPVLIHHGRSICESHMIIEYIDEVWTAPTRLLPGDPYERYLVRFWADFIDKKLFEILGGIFGLGKKSPEERIIFLDEIRKNYRELGITIERGLIELKERGCLYDGKSLKYMDIIIAPTVPWSGPMDKMLDLMLGDKGKCPVLNNWLDSLATNEMFTSTLTESTILEEYCKQLWF